MIIFCFTYLSVRSTEVNNDDFNLTLYGDWVKVTDDVLRKYEENVLLLSDGKENTIYQYGFQLKNASSFTSGPFILIKVQRLIKNQNLDNKMLNELGKSIDKIMDIGNATYVSNHNQYWLYYDDKYNQVEKVRVLMIQKLAIYGKVSIFFHAKITEFKENEPLFKKIAYSLSFNKNHDLQLITKKLTDLKVKQDNTSAIVMQVLGAIVTSIAIYIIKEVFTSKKQNRTENTTKFTTGDLKLIKDNPQEIIFEKKPEENIEFDLQGVFIADETEILNNSELKNILLLANYHIRKISGRFLRLAFIIGIGISIALFTGYIDNLFALNLDKLHVWRVYLIIPAITISLSIAITKPFQKRAYLKYKPAIQITAKKLGLSKYKLITAMDDQRDLKEISLFLKKDIKNNWA